MLRALSGCGSTGANKAAALGFKTGKVAGMKSENALGMYGMWEGCGIIRDEARHVSWLGVMFIVLSGLL